MNESGYVIIAEVSYKVPVFTEVSPGRTVPSRISSKRPIEVLIVAATFAHSGCVGYRRMFQSSNLGIGDVVVTGS